MKNPLARHGGLTYLRLPAPDPRTATFYERVCGWKIEPRDGGDYRFADPDGLMIGAFDSTAPPLQSGVVPYVYVDDLAAALATAEANGGSVVETIRAEGDIRVARLRDPSGNVIGLWQFAG